MLKRNVKQEMANLLNRPDLSKRIPVSLLYLFETLGIASRIFMQSDLGFIWKILKLSKRQTSWRDTVAEWLFPSPLPVALG